MPSAVAFLLCVSCMAMQPAEPVGVPELMKTFDGLPVTDRTIWETVRRRELRQRFLERMYGLPPVYAETPDMRFTLEEPDKTMMDGMAVRRRMRIHYRGPSGADSLSCRFQGIYFLYQLCQASVFSVQTGGFPENRHTLLLTGIRQKDQKPAPADFRQGIHRTGGLHQGIPQKL